jgi:diguanylate cyclase (GGDEF)-like protein/PAS domain S-box-containing protein
MNKAQSTTETAEVRLDLFDFAFENAPIGIALVDTKGRILRGNAVFAKMVGRHRKDIAGLRFREFTHPDDLQADLDLFDDVLKGKRDGYTIEKRYIKPSGDILEVMIHVAAMRRANGSVARLISQIEDISQHKQHERELAERAAQLELALEAVRGGFWQLDIPTGKFETSDRLAHFIGGPKAARLDLGRYLEKVHAKDGPQADLSPLIAGEVDQSVAEYRLETIDGERWMRCDRRLLRDSSGAPLKIVGMAIDFTNERKQIEMLAQSASTDILTGVLNRRGLTDRFGMLTSGDGFVVLAIDLDGFKKVNDSLGHGVGDAVLIETSQRLVSAVRANDLVCRTGGDEFIVVAPSDEVAGRAIAQRIVDDLRRSIVIGDVTAEVGASVGGVWSAEKQDLIALIHKADAQLYAAKAAGKNCVRF